MRLFAAVELDEVARRAVVEEQSRLSAAMKSQGPRLVKPDHLHLTLVFLGDVDDATSRRLIDAMTPDVERAPFQVTLAGVGVFPERGAPRILWLGVTKGSAEMRDLYIRVTQRLGTGETSERTFRPHITLGRWRPRRDKAARVPRAWSDAPVATIRVDSVTLFESQLRSTGPTYTRLAQARLQCR